MIVLNLNTLNCVKCNDILKTIIIFSISEKNKFLKRKLSEVLGKSCFLRK